MAILQPVAMLSSNEHDSIDEDKIPVNPWTPLFKIYTASPKIVSTELWKMNFWDRIIVGVLDDALSDRLQAKFDLTLADAARMNRQAEARKQN